MGKYKDRIDARFEAQKQKGIEKYGQVLEGNRGPYDYRLEHLAQELTDALMYLEWLREGGQVITAMFELLAQDLEGKELCPLATPCEPDNLKDGGCLECLKAYYTTEAEKSLCENRESEK